MRVSLWRPAVRPGVGCAAARRLRVGIDVDGLRLRPAVGIDVDGCG
jgi:hypothetical protein